MWVLESQVLNAMGDIRVSVGVYAHPNLSFVCVSRYEEGLEAGR